MDNHMDKELQTLEAKLARLADGSLPPAREGDLRVLVNRSPELIRALNEQERAVSMVRAAEAVAPDSLRLQLQAMTEAASRSRRARLRVRFVLPAATALAAVVAAVVVLAGGSATGPTLPQTARLALASATMAPPAADATHPERLSVAVDGIQFPNWNRTLGWRAVGTRSDTIGGTRIVTVFYTARRRYRVGYSIVSGSPLPVSGSDTVEWNGIRYTLATEGSTRLVTWREWGHTCVIAGREVSYDTLAALARAA